jgi:phage-related protein
MARVIDLLHQIANVQGVALPEDAIMRLQDGYERRESDGLYSKAINYSVLSKVLMDPIFSA